MRHIILGALRGVCSGVLGLALLAVPGAGALPAHAADDEDPWYDLAAALASNSVESPIEKSCAGFNTAPVPRSIGCSQDGGRVGSPVTLSLYGFRSGEAGTIRFYRYLDTCDWNSHCWTFDNQMRFTANSSGRASVVWDTRSAQATTYRLCVNDVVSCLRLSSKVTLTPVNPGGEVLTPVIGNGPSPFGSPRSSAAEVYGITNDGTLLCYQHAGFLTGANEWPIGGGLQVGTSWSSFRQVLSAGQAIYAIQPDGTLLWYRHGGADTCAEYPWAGPQNVGSGWQNFKQVVASTFSKGNGAVLYAIQDDGTLLWYRHHGYADGTPSWSGPATVGSGWQSFKHVFASSDGGIYAIQDDGTLLWYRHLGFADGSPTWSGPNKVGTGWQHFKHVFAGSGGVVYAIQPDGTLLWYRHLGSSEGTTVWSGPVQVGNDWQNFLTEFVRSPVL